MCATPRHAVGTLSPVKEWRSTDQRNCNRHAAPRRPLIAGRHPLHLWSAGLGHVALLQLQPFEKRTIRLQSLRDAALADQPLVDTQYLGSDDHAQALEIMNAQQWTNPIAARSAFRMPAACHSPPSLHQRKPSDQLCQPPTTAPAVPAWRGVRPNRPGTDLRCRQNSCIQPLP